MRTNAEKFFGVVALLTCVLGMLFFYIAFTFSSRSQCLQENDIIAKQSRPRKQRAPFSPRIYGPDKGRNILFITHNNDLTKITRTPVQYMTDPVFFKFYLQDYAPRMGLTTAICGLNSTAQLLGRETAVEKLEYSDISVMIYVGKNSYQRSLYWRIMTNDTFPDALIISSEYSPIQEIGLTLLPGIGEKYESNTPKHLLGLAAQYYAHPGRKWYYAGGDDTFIRGEMFKRTLENFDSNKPIWVGTLGWTLDWMPYVSGGAGVAMSRKLVEDLIGFVPLSLNVASSRWSDVFIGKFIWEYANRPPSAAYNWYAHAPETIPGLPKNPFCEYIPMLAGTYHYIKSPQQHSGLLRTYLNDLKTLGKLPQSYDVDAKVQSVQQQFDAVLTKYGLK